MKRMGMYCVLFAVLAALSWTGGAVDSPPVVGAEPASADVQPVEKDMHELMEYFFQPAYLRLKAAMKAEPKDKQGWAAIKSDSLLLAEGANLLLVRVPEEEGAAWREMSKQVRDAGGKLYAAGRQRDYTAARQHYAAMLIKCNACHTKFANGEHQLD